MNIDWISTVQDQAEGGWVVNGNLTVPDNPNNRHARSVQDWIAAGNTPAPADPLPPPPTKGEIYDRAVKGVVGAIIEAIDDGSLVPGGNLSEIALKAIITAKM